MFRLFIVTITVIVVAGCSATNIRKDFSFENVSESVAVFSVTQDDSESIYTAESRFFMNSGLFKDDRKMLLASEEAFPGGWNKASEFENVQGRLYAIRLSPGDHELSSWHIINGSGMTIEPRGRPAPLSFSLAGGEIKYLGNLHMRLRTAENLFGVNIIVEGYPEVHDKHERDIAMLEQRYPQFSGKVVKDVLKEGDWLEPQD
jgi:hypothetical protein